MQTSITFDDICKHLNEMTLDDDQIHTIHNILNNKATQKHECGGIYAYKLPLIVKTNVEDETFVVVKLGRVIEQSLGKRVAEQEGRVFALHTDIRINIPGCNKNENLTKWRLMSDDEFILASKSYADMMGAWKGDATLETQLRETIGTLILANVPVSTSCRSDFAIDKTQYYKNGTLKASGWKYWLFSPAPWSNREVLTTKKIQSMNVGPTEYIILPQSTFEEIRNTWIKSTRNSKFNFRGIKKAEWKISKVELQRWPDDVVLILEVPSK